VRLRCGIWHKVRPTGNGSRGAPLAQENAEQNKGKPSTCDMKSIVEVVIHRYFFK